MISFKVEGVASPQGSKKHIGRGIMIESSKHVANWRGWVRLRASQAMVGQELLSGPLSIRISFGFPRPKSHYLTKGLRDEAPTFHSIKPDVDKLLRAILDAMTGVVFNDDSQVACVACVKQYEDSPCTEIEVGRCSLSEIME